MVNKKVKKSKNLKTLKGSFSIAAAALIIFTTSLNISPTFAESLKDIPVIKNIASILIFADYKSKTEEIESEVKYPEIIIEKSDVDDYINEIIEEQVEKVLKEAQINAEEYKEAFIETGGTEEEYNKKNMTVSVDYEIFIQDENYLSFRVFSYEKLAAAYASYLYFTVDLREEKLVTLEDLLGSDYEDIMTQSVLKQIEKNIETDENIYFDNHKKLDFKVRFDIDFYLTEDYSIVIVFQKYELAPGAYGRLEFLISIK